MGFWPAASARITSPRCASCSPWLRLRPNARMQARPKHLPAPRRSASVPVAAAACSLSRPSREAAGAAGPHRPQRGSTRHEQDRKRFHPDCCAPLPPPSCRPRRCSSRRISTDAIRAQASPLAAAQAAASPRCGYCRVLQRRPAHLLGHAASPSHADGAGKILIALCCRGWCPAPRAFLPRRLSDARPVVRAVRFGRGRHPKPFTQLRKWWRLRSERSANGCLPNTEAESKVRSLACMLMEVGGGRLTSVQLRPIPPCAVRNWNLCCSCISWKFDCENLGGPGCSDRISASISGTSAGLGRQADWRQAVCSVVGLIGRHAV